MTVGVLLQTANTVAAGVRAIAARDGIAAHEWAIHLASLGLLFWWIAEVAHMPWWQYVLFIAYPGASLTMLRSFYEHRLARIRRTGP